jgi:Na+-driven multidrug efflux pump
MGFAYIFAFYFKLEMYGIWIARISSGLTNCLIFYIILRNVDVGTEIIKVHERLEAQKAKNEAELQELEDMA